MSNDTNESGTPTNESGTPSEPNESANTLVIRDFLYLDQERIFSYLSQIEGGLKILFSRFANETWRELKGPPEITTDRGVDVTGKAGGSLLGLADISLDATARALSSIKSGPEFKEKGGLDGTSELFGLHHKAFDLVMSRLGDRFCIVSGRIEIIDFSAHFETIKDFPLVAKHFTEVAKIPMKAPANTKSIHYLLDKFSRNKILVMLKDENGDTVSSYLQDKHLTSSITSITDNFGLRPSGKFTLVGIAAPNDRSRIDFSETFINANEAGEEMGKTLLGMFQSEEEMSSFWRLKSQEMHVFPLALYSEL